MKISTPGVNVANASTSQLILNSNYPFIKLDTQSTTSFLTINLVLLKDTPEPTAPATDAITTVYQFAHGLNYAPKIWALFQVTIPPVGTHFYQPYFQEAGVIGGTTVDDLVTMFYSADNQNIYIKVDKYNDGVGSANNIIGATFKITLLTFIDDFTTS